MVKRDESGQTLTEYVLLLAAILSFFVTVGAGIRRWGLEAKILKPLNERFAKAYQYGHPDALGYDDGGPKKHPRAPEKGNGNFRIFTLN